MPELVTDAESVRQVEVVFRVGHRFGVVSFWRVVLRPVSQESNLFSVARSGIFHARLRAIELLESARIHLLSALHRTAKLRRERNYNTKKAAKPSPSESLECPAQAGTDDFLIPQQKFLPGHVPCEIWRGLQHQFARLALLCLCFWRTQFWMQSMLARKSAVGNPALYIEFLSSPLPSPFISQNPRQVNK